jgi:iron-sulfur cluster assembly protein
MAITVTEIAQNQIRSILSSPGNTAVGIRVGVKGGGCSGLSYKMDPEANQAPNDHVFEFDGFKVFCDPKSYLYLNGLILDFGTELMGGGFRFINPQATKTCGCGQSFSA